MIASIILTIFSVVPALIFWIFFVRFCSRRIKLMKNGSKTMGSIVDWVYHGYFNSKNVDFYYSPIVKFFDEKNDEHRFESNYRTSLGKLWSNIRFAENKVNVIYNKEDPNECEINLPSAIWGASVTPFILAIIFTFVAALAVDDLLKTEMGLKNLFVISQDQFMICIMLLVLFVGVLLLWDLFSDTPGSPRR